MLDCNVEEVPAVDQFERLRCSAKLPEFWGFEIEQNGLAPTLPDCKRRFPRLRCRGRNAFIALELRQTLPGLPRTHEWMAVYITDFGRGGIGILHGDPMYPKERVRVVLSDGKARVVEVVRCERIDTYCYSIGARFVVE